MSKKRSPGDGAGSAANPRCGPAVSASGGSGGRSCERSAECSAPSPLDLELGLVAEPLERGVADAGDRGCRRAPRRARRVVAMPTCGELAGLVAAHAGDEGEVVVGAAALLAHVDPAADAAVVDRLGIGVDGVPGRATHERLVARLERAVVGGVVGDAEWVLLAVAGDDVHLRAARRPGGARPARSRRTSGGWRRPSPGGRAWRRRPRRTSRRGRSACSTRRRKSAWPRHRRRRRWPGRSRRRPRASRRASRPRRAEDRARSRRRGSRSRRRTSLPS